MNKRKKSRINIRAITLISIMILPILILLFSPNNKKEQNIKKEKPVLTIKQTYTMSNDILHSSIKEIKMTEMIKETVETSSNWDPYTYYEVYDFFYGSNQYHSLDYELQRYTYNLCVEYGIEEYYTLILCQLYYESQYRADVISASNDYGIAQINICNHKWLSKTLGITNFLDPEQSILCNIYMMSNNLKKYSVESSLFCYNTGKPNGSNTYSNNIIYMWNNGVREIEE